MQERLEKLRFWLLRHLVTLWWMCESYLEVAPSHKTKGHVFFEPISMGAIITSLIVSGISFGVNYAIARLTAPKPKQQVLGKMTGVVTLTDSILGAPIHFVAGGRPAGSNFGGVELGSNIIWLPQIDKIQRTVQSSGGNKKTGSGPSNIEITYRCNAAFAVGEGPLRLLRLKFNEDTVYNITGSGGTPPIPPPSRFEAEAVGNTLSGGANVVADAACSNAQKVTGIGLGGKLTFNDIDVDLLFDPPNPVPTTRVPYFDIRIKYKCAGDKTAFVKLDGTGGTYTFPETSGTDPGTKYIQRLFTYGEHTLEISNPGAAGPDIDCIDVGIIYITEPTPVGSRDEAFPAEAEADNILLSDPNDFDTNPLERFSGNVAPEDGALTIALTGGGTLVWYEGNETQTADPVIAAQVNSVFGANSCPAFRGVAYGRLSNINISKYGSFPQIRAVVENTELQMVEEICLSLALRAGLSEDDVDFSAGADKHIRGIYTVENIVPEKIFEQLAFAHNLTFVETHDGLLTLKDLSDRTVKATIPAAHLAAYVEGESEETPVDDVMSSVEDESELILTQELSFHNPEFPSNYATDRVSYTYPLTDSKRTETKSVNLTLLPAEAESINRRELQRQHLKALAPHAVTIPHAYCWLDGADCILVEIDGEYKLCRIEDKTGSAPGTYELVLSSEAIEILADEAAVVEDTPETTINDAVLFPANTVGTIIDIPPLVDEHERATGVYAAACQKPGFGKWRGASLYRYKGGEWIRMAIFERPCSMGVAVNALADIPDGLAPGLLDDSSSLIVDFYGDYEPMSVSDEFVQDGAETYVAGGEVFGVRDWERDNDYPNRWIGTNIYRILKNTSKAAAAHVAGERVVMLNDAVKFIPLDAAEINTERTWKFVTSGQEIDDAAPISFEWSGANVYNREQDAPEIGQIFDATQTEIRIGIRGYTKDALYRKIEVSENSDMSEAETEVIAAAEYNFSILPPEFILIRSGEKTEIATHYIRISHSSNNVDFSESSNVLEVTFADDAGAVGSSGGFSASPDMTLEVI